MGPVLFIILVIIAIIILGVIIFCILKITNDSINNTSLVIEIGDFCSDTLNCPLGLECDDGRCRIPKGGPCLLFPNLCVNGTTCINGRCTNLLESEEINFPIIDTVNNDINSKFNSIYIDNKLIYQGNFIDASTTSEKLIENGIWIVNNNKISYITNKGKLHSYNLNKQIISCEAFDDICFILCDDCELYLANFNSQINVENLEFPTIYENEIIDDGEIINLGRSVQNKIMIIMTNGIWMINSFNHWSWIELDNSNITYLSFISNKKLTMYNDGKYSYGTISGKWENKNYPKIEKGKVVNSEYWYKSILGLI